MSDLVLTIILSGSSALVTIFVLVVVANRGLVGLFHAIGEIFLAGWDRLVYGPARTRPAVKAQGPLDGMDLRVARVIENDGTIEEIVAEAELLAHRQHNAVVPRSEQVGLPPKVVSLPHVTATTPRVVYPSRYPACPNCDFEMLTSFGGEVAVPVRTWTCPDHAEEDD